MKNRQRTHIFLARSSDLNDLIEIVYNAGLIEFFITLVIKGIGPIAPILLQNNTYMYNLNIEMSIRNGTVTVRMLNLVNLS